MTREEMLRLSGKELTQFERSLNRAPRLENFQVGLSPEQHKALLSIKERTRVPMSALVREAIDVVISLHAKST